MMDKEKAAENLVKYLTKLITKNADKYNSGKCDETILNIVCDKKDRVFSCYYHNIGLSVKYLTKLDKSFYKSLWHNFCPGFHALNTLDNTQKETNSAKIVQPNTSESEDTTNGSIYIVEKQNGYVKIGVSTHPEERISRLEYMNGERFLKYWISQPTSSAYKIEKKLHNYFSSYRTLGEWFDIKFQLAKKRVETFAELHGKTFIPTIQARIEA